MCNSKSIDLLRIKDCRENWRLHRRGCPAGQGPEIW